MTEITLKLGGGTIHLEVGNGNGRISSNLHYDSLEEFLDAGGEEAGDPLDDRFSYGRYEGAIFILESIILSAAQAGIDVQSDQFTETIQTTLDAIGNHLS